MRVSLGSSPRSGGRAFWVPRARARRKLDEQPGATARSPLHAITCARVFANCAPGCDPGRRAWPVARVSVVVMRFILVCFALSFGIAACGGSSGSPPSCTGATCTCPSGKTCDVSSSNCGPSSCSLDCENSTDCTGSCGSSCSIKCDGSSTCTMTVGPSASVDCSGASTCDISCTGSCSLTCANGSTCELKCATDASPKMIASSGSCP